MTQTTLKEAHSYIKSKTTTTPEIGLILGSGLGSLGDEIEEQTIIKYEDIPHFPKSTVAGHKGQLVIGTLQGKKVVAMQGRFHYYEGYSMEQVTFPVRLMKELGVTSVIVTNAAGGINKEFNPGDLMIITDHINQTGTNPLIGPNDEKQGVRFPDMTSAYDPTYVEHAKTCAKNLELVIQTGTYVGNIGPTYETPAEIKMLSSFGGDAVGMSTVPEVIVARHAGLKVLGISCISNMAAGILDEQLTHEDVIKTTERVKNDFMALVNNILKTFPS